MSKDLAVTANIEGKKVKFVPIIIKGKGAAEPSRKDIAAAIRSAIITERNERDYYYKREDHKPRFYKTGYKTHKPLYRSRRPKAPIKAKRIKSNVTKESLDCELEAYFSQPVSAETEAGELA